MKLQILTNFFTGLILLCVSIQNVKADEGWWHPSGILSWDWQLTEPFDNNRDVTMIDLDLFETSRDKVALFKKRGIKTICYINVGAWENWREDANKFPKNLLGHDYADWQGEKWLDIRRIDQLSPLIEARLNMCKVKGFDGIEPDNIDGYTNDTGFNITFTDQLRYNRWLAQEAHKRGLSIGLKNNPDQVSLLVNDYDWALSESCFKEGWCQKLLPFVNQKKSVFAAEYSDQNMTLQTFCATAKSLGISAILKKRELNDWWKPCP